MQFLKKFSKICDGINEWIGSYLVCAIVFCFVGIIFANVIMRYAFNTSFVFMAELEWHLFAMIFLVGAGYTLLHDRHVRVDIFYSIMSPKKRALVNCIGVILLLIPSCFLVLTTAIPWVISAYQIGEVSINPGGIPARFAIKAMLPLGYGLILLQGISIFCKNLIILTEKST